MKDALSGQPDQRSGLAWIVHSHGAGAGQLPDRANPADFLLPDIMSINTASADGFPNGRRLQDDVIDIELNLISNGAITSDCVANDSTFRTTFPYWAGPNVP